MKKFVLAVTAFVLVAFAQTAEPVVNSFTDKRDGKTYRMVKIGSQVWMAENLNFKTKGSKCYDSDSSEPVVNSFTDKRDGKTYRTVKIGGQVWMAENLNFKTKGSKCYNNDTSYCTKYGRLYDWAAAMTACPAGWHLPSDAEWTQLTDAVGGSSKAGTKLKSSTGWNNNGNGTDDYGFSALLGGFGYSDGSFYDTGNYGRWWSATEYDASSAWIRGMNGFFENVYRNDYLKAFLFSVRCVQD